MLQVYIYIFFFFSYIILFETVEKGKKVNLQEANIKEIYFKANFWNTIILVTFFYLNSDLQLLFQLDEKNLKRNMLPLLNIIKLKE